MTDILDTLKSYLDNPSAVMSKRVVNDVIDEIARLRVERDAVRSELSDALVLAAQHLDCFRTERWELGNVMRERDFLRAELAAEREKIARTRLYATAPLKLEAVTAERDALRALLVRARAWIADGKVDFNDALVDDIDAALDKGDGDE